jgi:hypothetical protein
MSSKTQSFIDDVAAQHWHIRVVQRAQCHGTLATDGSAIAVAGSNNCRFSVGVHYFCAF